VKQDVLLKVMQIIADEGAEMAFPTSTIHLAKLPENEMFVRQQENIKSPPC